jgi:hypothetical protein
VQLDRHAIARGLRVLIACLMFSVAAHPSASRFEPVAPVAAWVVPAANRSERAAERQATTDPLPAARLVVPARAPEPHPRPDPLRDGRYLYLAQCALLC